jgi:hypothetical protein
LESDAPLTAIFVQRQKIQPFAGFIEPIKLLLDDQQLLTKGIGLVGQPFLQMLALAQLHIGKALLCYAGQTVLG